MTGTGWRERYIRGSREAEIESIKGFADRIHRIQDNQRAGPGRGGFRRAFHAKQLVGTEQAILHVESFVPDDLQNRFLQPGQEWPVTVRFSNASGVPRPDTAKDLRGVAVRIHTTQGDLTHTYDLLATNFPVSHARDAEQFMAVGLHMSGNRLFGVIKLLFTQGPFQLWRILRNLRKARNRKVRSLASESFWSRSAYAIGDVAFRFEISPGGPVTGEEAPGADYLRTDLVRRLEEGKVVFLLRVQRFVDEKRTPIENGAREWEESDSPFVTVGRIVLPQQELTGSAARDMEKRVDALEFNPWNTADDFRPLGSLNRARRFVYENSANLRTLRNAPRPREGLLVRGYRAVATPSFNLLNRIVPWHRLWSLLGSLNLEHFRYHLRWKNLHDTEEPAAWPTARQPEDYAMEPEAREARHPEGKFNDMGCPFMGSRNARFGRNTPLHLVEPLGSPKYDLLDPNPYDVAEGILTRDEFKPAAILNLTAAAWIQFMIHGWINHPKRSLEDTPADERHKIPIAGGQWGSDSMEIPITEQDGTLETPNGEIPVYRNTETHWWDGSQLYGSTQAIQDRVRSFEGGKLKVMEQNGNWVLPYKKKDGGPQLDITGFNDNWWIGLSLLHATFTLEHNAICDMLGQHYPEWSDERIFQKARLILSALLAKIHTVEWTPAILAHPTLQVAMDANWWGLLGENLTQALGRFGDAEILSGIIGSPTDHQAAPYSLTEEFALVYFMHPLIPDEVRLTRIESGEAEDLAFDDVVGAKVRGLYDRYRVEDLYYSFGLMHPGAITLRNYPKSLRKHTRINGEVQDIAVRDLVRARERHVPRYNDFREMLRLPRVASFRDLTPGLEDVKELHRLYDGDIDKVDAMVGMFAESPPAGFGFSDTAFRIFIAMASRRLKSDRFFTRDYTPEMYTPEGIRWIQDNEMRSVLRRHYPGLAGPLSGVTNAFAPWRRVHPEESHHVS